jgi:hypothetical protein
MAILLTTAGRNALLASGKAGFTHVSAVVDIGATPTEATGVTRQAVTWGTASGGTTTNTGALTIPVGASNTVVGVGLYDAVTGGNVLGVALQGSTTPPYGFVIATASTDVFTGNIAHGITTDDRVAFVPVANGSLPAGVSATTLYFVLASGLTSTAFKVATTSGGTTIDVTADGNAVFGKTTPQTFSLSGNLTIAIGAITLDLRAV